jgi:uncharacterized SAM-dependent methyltransferase
MGSVDVCSSVLISTDHFSVLDIRQHVNIDLQREIVQGLQSTPKYLPSLLMWDSKGLRLFEKFAESNDYYATRTEMGLLDLHAERMATAIEPGSVLIELGGGCSFVSSFSRPFMSVSVRVP